VRAESRRPEARPPAFSYREVGHRAVRGTSASLHRDSAGPRHELFCDQIPITTLARRYGTPLYVYSASAIRHRLCAFDRAFSGIPHTICYSVKANSNLSILRLLNRTGCGFDVVSGGELRRVLKVDRRANRRIVFSGVGKSVEEIDLALRSGILLFNVESESELARLAQRAALLKKTGRIALRVNPDVPAETHPYISTGLHQHKFGVPIEEARRLYASAAKGRFLKVAGISVHIGSQITSPEPFGAAMNRVAELVRQLREDGHQIQYVDAGGGLGIWYEGSEHEEFPEYAGRYAAALSEPLRDLDLHLLLEPGRAIVGPAGALVTSVQYVKENNHKRFLVVDAAMNDLIRPSLYGAFHEIVPVRRSDQNPEQKFDVVGPICETGDFFARDRQLPEVGEGEFLAILDTGAYGMALSSNYNSRARAAEVLVDGKSVKPIRRRESFTDLIRTELS
jgi:diaminopimelate decarboxylase